MSDYKENVKALTYEELLQKNLELRQTITNLRNQIEENNKWTATVYANHTQISILWKLKDGYLKD